MTTKRIYGKKTTRHTYTVTDETHEALKWIGGGNASRGLRMAVDLAECAEGLAEALRCHKKAGTGHSIDIEKHGYALEVSRAALAKYQEAKHVD